MDTSFYSSIKMLVFLLIAIIGFQATIYAQNIVFNHIGVENGLSQNSVLAIAQDDKGFMWYGTRFGLNRYDGQHFKIYKNKTADTASLSNDYILSLLQDAHHTFWVGTVNGLNKYNVSKDAFERVRLPFDIQGNTQINTIYEDKKGNIWVGASTGLYLLTDRNHHLFRRFSITLKENSIAGDIVRSIYEDSNNNIWIGTTNGLTKMRFVNGDYQCKTFRHSDADFGSISNNAVMSILEDEQHQLWMGTSNGLNLYQPKNGNNSFVHFVHGNSGSTSIVNNIIRKIITDRAGKLWIGTQEGLSILDPVAKTFSSYQQGAADKRTLSQNSIHSLFEDANGSIWIGTFFGGINIAYSYSTTYSTLQSNEGRSSLSNNVVSGMAEDEKHNLWIGTEGGGLNYFDRAANTFKVYKNRQGDVTSLGSNLVKKVCRDKEGNVWVGTHGGGLNLLAAGKQNFQRFFYTENDVQTSSAEIGAILIDHKNQLWLGTGKTLSVFSKNNSVLTPLPAALDAETANLPVTALFEDSKRNMWVASTSGLFKINDGHAVRLKTDNANCVTEDSKGRIWAGFYYGGLAMYNAEKQGFDIYTEKDGLPNNNVVGILEDDKTNLWVSTDNGLVRFNPNTKSFQNYTLSDGLAGNGFNYNSYFKDSRGEFFFGGYNGLTSFFPNNILTNNYVAPMAFTGLRLFNEPVDINTGADLLRENISTASKLVFNYNQNVFTIEFALLNFIKSGKNKYEYKLDGFDNNWNEVATPSATYTNLPAGKYTLFVKGANNDGIWSKPISIQIVVLPPFWKAWWAYCFYVLLLAAIIFLVVRFFFLRALIEREEELHQVKLNFFTNISHEIRTHLTLIMAPIDKLLDQNKQNGFTYQQLFHVKNNANRLLKLVSELMDFRKAETNHLQLYVARYDMVDFLGEIYASFQDLSLIKNIATSFVHDTENAPVYFDREQMEKVFFNLLTNAFKFTQEGGRIILNLEQKNNSVKISVTDNGRGIAPEYLEKLFNNFFQVADHGLQNTGYGIGLALSKNIVELHKGNLSVESELAFDDKAGKTTFTVTLLQGNKHLANAENMLQPEAKDNMENDGAKIKKLTVETNATPFETEKPMTILVVEDNAELRQLIHETFIGTYHVLLGGDGLQGWNMATEHIPDLIISDVTMPEMDGFQLCGKLKTDERTSHIPVVLLTAKSAQTDQVSGLETGADVYLTKPFSTKVLELNVRNLLVSREKMRLRFEQQVSALPVMNIPSAIVSVQEVVEATPYSNPIDQGFLNKIMALVDEYMDDPEFGVDMFARKVAMSPPILYKKLKAVTGMSVNDFIKSLRLKRAAQLLQQKQMTVTEVCYAIGYNDRKYFSKEFKKLYGKTPTDFMHAEDDANIEI